MDHPPKKHKIRRAGKPRQTQAPLTDRTAPQTTDTQRADVELAQSPAPDCQQDEHSVVQETAAAQPVSQSRGSRRTSTAPHPPSRQSIDVDVSKYWKGLRKASVIPIDTYIRPPDPTPQDLAAVQERRRLLSHMARQSRQNEMQTQQMLQQSSELDNVYNVIHQRMTPDVASKSRLSGPMRSYSGILNSLTLEAIDDDPEFDCDDDDNDDDDDEEEDETYDGDIEGDSSTASSASTFRTHGSRYSDVSVPNLAPLRTPPRHTKPHWQPIDPQSLTELHPVRFSPLFLSVLLLIGCAIALLQISLFHVIICSSIPLTVHADDPMAGDGATGRLQCDEPTRGWTEDLAPRQLDPQGVAEQERDGLRESRDALHCLSGALLLFCFTLMSVRSSMSWCVVVVVVVIVWSSWLWSSFLKNEVLSLQTFTSMSVCLSVCPPTKLSEHNWLRLRSSSPLLSYEVIFYY
jgi:hypothetical protein